MDTSTGLVLVATVPVMIAIVQYVTGRSAARDIRNAKAADREEARKAAESAQQAARDAKDAAAHAATEVRTVADKLHTQGALAQEQLDEMAKVGINTHTLVNNAMGVQLKLAAELSEFKAATTKLPEDIQAALLARTRYEEHLKKQAIVDSGVPPPR